MVKSPVDVGVAEGEAHPLEHQDTFDESRSARATPTSAPLKSSAAAVAMTAPEADLVRVFETDMETLRWCGTAESIDDATVAPLEVDDRPSAAIYYAARSRQPWGL